jgi:hypothetical protein
MAGQAVRAASQLASAQSDSGAAQRGRVRLCVGEGIQAGADRCPGACRVRGLPVFGETRAGG